MMRRGPRILASATGLVVVAALVWAFVWSRGVPDDMAGAAGGDAMATGERARSEASRSVDPALPPDLRIESADTDDPTTQAVLGRLLSAPSHGPLEAARLEVRDPSGAVVGGAGTAADGRFRIAGLPADVALVLDARVAGYGIHSTPIAPLAAAETRDLGDITLESGARLRGHVRSVDGDGIPGALVALRRTDMPRSLGSLFSDIGSFFVERRPLLETVTAADGSFEVTEVPSGNFHIAAAAEGYAQGFFHDVFATGNARLPELEFVLQAASRLQVRVLGPKAEPLEGAAVCVTPEAAGNDLSVILQRAVGVTDARGSCAFDALEAGPKMLIVTDRNGRIVIKHAVAAPGECDVTMDAERTVFGRVTVQETGSPVIGLRLTFYGKDEVQTVVSGAQGSYRVGPFRSNEIRFLIPEPAADLTLAANAEVVKMPIEATAVEHDIRLVAGTDVEGRVVDADTGEPIVGAVVWSGNGPALSVVPVCAMTDSEGVFRLRGVRAKDNQLWARATSYSSSGLPTAERTVAVAIASPGQPVRDVVLRLKRAVTLRGRVRDGAGESVVGARVATGWRSPYEAALLGDVRRDTVTDAAGAYEMLADPEWPGEVRLRITHPDFAPATVRVDQVTRGGVEYERDVVLEAEAVIEGRVRHKDGRPLAKVRVHATPLRPEGDGPALTVGDERDEVALGLVVFSDEDGAFQVRVPPGRVALAASVNGLAPFHGEWRRATAAAGARVRVKDIVMSPVGRLSILVVDQRSKPVDGTSLALRRVDDDGGRYEVQVPTDPGGRHTRVWPLPEGHYDVTVTFASAAQSGEFSEAGRMLTGVAVGDGDSRHTVKLQRR